MKVAEFLVDRLINWGVNRIYGYPGDAINSINAAIAKNASALEFVEARHEEMAAFMACAHAKFTGTVGVCLSTSGPGAIHLLNGLYDAKLDNQPVVAIVGQQQRKVMGSDYMQEVDLANLFKDVAHDYVHVATTAEQIRHLIDRCMRISIAERTVTCLIIPADLQMEKMPHLKHEHGQTFSGVGYSVPRVIPQELDLRRAADLLNAGERVAMLIGAGCIGATDEVINLAEILQAGVAKALLGKSVLPDDLSFVTGSIGLLGTKPSWELMQGCDTLLMIGSNFPYAEFLPKEGKARGVQIDLQPRNISLRYPMEVNLVGDARETILELMPLLKQKPTSGAWRSEIETNVAEWWRVVAARAEDEAVGGINPQRFFWHVNDKLPDNAMLISDCGTSTVWMARDIKLRRGMMATTSGGLATMGCAMPYAIGAKFAFPDRPVFAFIGDGAMQMNGNSELVTVAKYWQQWSNPQLIIVVLNNRDLSYVSWEQRAQAGMPKIQATQELPDVQYAEYARMLGLNGVRVESSDQIDAAWATALSSDRPTVIDLCVDRNMPPLPPHITVDEAKAFVQSMRADPERVDAFFDSVRQMADTIFPGFRS
jgi:pyruvate dehydrogenase (quinone)